MKRNTDLGGQHFGFLTVLGIDHRGQTGKTFFRCRCDCGSLTTVVYSDLLRGHVLSCGCLRTRVNREMRTTHGGKGSPEYNSWQGMIARCHNPNNRAYARYGGRGIVVYDAWRHDFAAFLRDVGPRPSPNHSLDRIDNSDGYRPGNVRWATPAEQAKNTRRSLGVETQRAIGAAIADGRASQRQLASQFAVSQSTIWRVARRAKSHG